MLHFFLIFFLAHVNNLFTYLYKKFVSGFSSSKLCHFSIGEFHFGYSFLKSVISLRAKWICEFKFFGNWFWHLFVQMNSAETLWVMIFQKRGMRSPLIPYLILVYTESMMQCSIIQPNNKTFRAVSELQYYGGYSAKQLLLMCVFAWDYDDIAFKRELWLSWSFERVIGFL